MFEFSIIYQNENKVWTVLEDYTRPVINKNTLDETHDESQIFLSCSVIDKPFKPFTKFIIDITELNEDNEIIGQDTFYRVVVSDEMEQKTFDEEPYLYNHDIRLSEASKDLERYTVDNLSFTNYWKKAFAPTNGAVVISQVQDNYTGWYDNSPWYVVSGIILAYPNKYPQGGSYSQDSVPIRQTIIFNTLSNNTTINNFTFSNSLPSFYQQNETLNVPNIEVSTLWNILLDSPIVPGSLYLQRTNYYAQFDSYVDISLVYPNGSSSTVTQGQSVSLTNTGTYYLNYTVHRRVRNRTWTYWRLDDKTISDTYSQWYDGINTTIQMGFTVIDTSVPDIDKLSIYDVCNRLLQTTPTRFTQAEQQTYYLDPNVRLKYGAIEAPEMIFTGKNLWETLKMIGSVVNAIPYLKITDINNWNVIDFFPLSSEEQEEDTVEQEYCNSTSYYLSDSYTGSYDMYVDNMINPLSTKEGQINEQGWYISKSLRSEEVEISETSMNIPTVYPIYRVNRLRYVDYYGPGGVSIDLDMTLFLNEIALYNTLPSASISEGKALSLCYTQGKQNITGLQYKVSKNVYTNAGTVISLKQILQSYLGSSLPTGIDFLKGKFIVEYTPYLNARIKFFKSNAPKLGINTAMFQNQTANVVDARALGRKMVANLGRTANLGYQDSLKVYSLNEIPLKGQRSKDGYFVSTVTTEYDQNHLLSSVVYTKDYQKISDWINIANLQRYFEVSEKQSVGRYVNTHMFYIFGDPTAEINKNFGLNQKSDYPNKNYMASLLIDQGYNRKINASILRGYSYVYNPTTDATYQANIVYYKQVGDSFEKLIEGTDYDIGQSVYSLTQDTLYKVGIYYYELIDDVYALMEQGVDYQIGDEIPTDTIYNISFVTNYETVSKVYLNSNALAVGNNISIITDFQDNYSAGYQAKGYIDGVTQALMNKAVPYSNKFGQLDRIEVQNITDSNIVYTPSATLETNMDKLALSLPAITDLNSENRPTGSEYIIVRDSYTGDNMPTVSNIGCNQEIQINKDSREVIHINQQHHFLKNDDNIIIGNAMVEKCRYIQESEFTARLVFLNNLIDDYEFVINTGDIVPVEVVSVGEKRIEYSQIIYDLTQGITSSNILDILSMEVNDSSVYSSFTSETITGISVDKVTWETQVEQSGIYNIVYDGTNWIYTGETIDLADYGITLTGTPSLEDVLIIDYVKSVYIQPNRKNNGKIVGLTEDAKAWAIITDTNELIIGQNIDLYANDEINENIISPVYMSVTSKF